MTADTAHIPVALNEVLLPSELEGLIAVSKAEKRKPGEIIVLAVRDFLARRNKAIILPTSNTSPKEAA